MKLLWSDLSVGDPAPQFLPGAIRASRLVLRRSRPRRREWWRAGSSRCPSRCAPRARCTRVRQRVISAQVVGRVQQVLVHEGDTVRAGQTLAVLDDATLTASVDQAQAAVKAAENQQAAAQTNADLAASTLARYKQLQAQKSVSPQELDEVSRRAEASSAQVEALRAAAGAAKAQESGARAMLAYTRITAPFAGIITARMVDPGSAGLARRATAADRQRRPAAIADHGRRVRDRLDPHGHEDQRKHRCSALARSRRNGRRNRSRRRSGEP